MNEIPPPSPPLVFVPGGTPRRVSGTPYVGSMGCFTLIFGGLFGGIGWVITLAFLFGGGPFWEDWIVSAKGVPATAVVTGVESTSSSVNGRRVQRIRFRFRDAQGGEQRASSSTTDPSVLNRAHTGDQIGIHYDPGKPSRARIDGTKISFFGLFALIPFLFAAIGMTVLGFGLRGILRRRRLYVWGESTTGKVTNVTDSNTRINNRVVLRIRYTFNGPFGPAEGTMDNMEAPPEGAEVTVLYDPREPSRNVLPLPGAFGV